MTPVSEDPIGQIVSVDNGSHLALVEVLTSSICARCSSGKGCGAGLLGGTTKTRRVAAKFPEEIRLSRGDTVQMSIEPGNLLQAAFWVYGAPLLGGVLGALSAYQLQLSDLGAVACAAIGLMVGMTAARRITRREQCVAAFTPIIRSRVDIPVADQLRDSEFDNT